MIDDNTGVCPPDTTGDGAMGVVQTEIQEPVEEVTINLTASNGSIMHTYTTGKDGQFHFFVPILDYSMEAERNDNHKNGVSTLDLVEIFYRACSVFSLRPSHLFPAVGAPAFQKKDSTCHAFSALWQYFGCNTMLTGDSRVKT